jgi:hypothetical protein
MFHRLRCAFSPPRGDGPIRFDAASIIIQLRTKSEKG